MEIGLEGLPLAYRPCTPQTVARYIKDALDLIQSPVVASLVQCHPNQVVTTEDAFLPDELRSWWPFFDELADGEVEAPSEISGPLAFAPSPLRLIVEQGSAGLPENTPESLKTLLSSVESLLLDRKPSYGPTRDRPRPGMSYKKAHEVARLSNLIQTISIESPVNPIRHIVDAGAGQGYLSRELAHPSTSSSNHEPAPCMHVLALESSDIQVDGALRRSEALSTGQGEGNVTFRKSFISADTLAGDIDTWLEGHYEVPEGDFKKYQKPAQPIPVLLTGLHACGSLTPAVLHAFISLAKDEKGYSQPLHTSSSWYPGGLAIVGCCYNLMSDRDFPLSSVAPRSLHFTTQHLQLAAQAPSQWVISPSEWDRSRLARKKIVYRALLELHLRHHPLPDGAEFGRLKRLNDKAYDSWEVYIKAVMNKIGVASQSTTPSSVQTSSQKKDVHDLPSHFRPLARRLAVLHVIRALIGPLIESVIIADRALFLSEQLADRMREERGVEWSASRWRVRTMNLFEQSSGSARNVVHIVDRVTS